MEPESKVPIPNGCESEEFNRFDNLLKEVLKVPRKDIQEPEKKKVPKKAKTKVS
jgi:hypothetical protein